MTIFFKVSPTGVVAALAVGLAGCNEPLPAGDAKAPLHVEVSKVKMETVVPQFRVTGLLKAKDSVSVSFRTDGTISTRKAFVGQTVTAGDVLAEMTASDQLQDVEAAQSAVEAALAAADQARVVYDRQQALAARGIVAKADFESATASVRVKDAALNQARSNLEIAKQQLQHTSLRAGVAGTVTSVQMEVGQYVQSGQVVATIAVNSGLQAVFPVPAAMIDGSGGNAGPTPVSLIADPSVVASATFAEMAPIVDPKSGTVEIKLDIDKPPPTMTLGLAVQAEAQGRGFDGFKVPKAALSAWNGKPALWLIDPATQEVRLQPVEIKTVVDDTLVIGTGLSDGDMVVTRGGQFLSPGQIVQPDMPS